MVDFMANIIFIDGNQEETQKLAAKRAVNRLNVSSFGFHYLCHVFNLRKKVFNSCICSRKKARV